MGLLLNDIQIQSQKKLISILRYFSLFFFNRLNIIRSSLRNIENNRNLRDEKFHRYKAFSLRKQKWEWARSDVRIVTTDYVTTLRRETIRWTAKWSAGQMDYLT